MSTEVDMEVQPRYAPQNFEQRKEDDEKMLTGTRIIHKHKSEAISRKGWVLGDPPHKELLMDLYVPRDNRIGHPGIPVQQSIFCYEMEHLSIFLATESGRS